MLDAGCWILDAGCSIFDAGYWKKMVEGIGFKV
jgi:hypothetical protein